MNKTIKIIDLLNKIANGEEIPRVEYDDIECYLGADGYLKDNYGENVEWWIDKNWLNKEVEIIEDNNKLEKMEHFDLFDFFTGYDYGGTNESLLKDLEMNFQHINNELAYLVDHINKIEENLDE